MSPQHKPAAQHVIVDEHARLRETLESIRLALSHQRGRCESIVPMLHELAESVLDHFEHEEVGGYFEELTELAPRLSQRAQELLSEHRDMVSQLSELQELAARHDENTRWSARLEESYARFLACFRVHEAAENELLQEAYGDDIGEED